MVIEVHKNIQNHLGIALERAENIYTKKIESVTDQLSKKMIMKGNPKKKESAKLLRSLFIKSHWKIGILNIHQEKFVNVIK